MTLATMGPSDDVPASEPQATRIQNAPAGIGRGALLGGRYEVERVLGEGGMGVVVSAVDTTDGRSVALKFLRPEAARDFEVRERFLREGRAAATIACDHVVRVFDAGVLESGSPFLVMELLLGQDLGQVLDERGALPVEEAVDHVLEALVALGLAHLRGIVHRDLKPANLFLTRRADGGPIIKVLDFGLSKDSIGRDDLALTKTTQAAMGSPLYMAPEQIRSFKAASFGADIWAMGIILFELVSHQVPFDGESIGGLFASIAADPPRRLEDVLPSAPAALSEAIARCLEKDPARRPLDVPSLAILLAPFAGPRGRAAFARLQREHAATARGWDPGDGATQGRGVSPSSGRESFEAAPTALIDVGSGAQPTPGPKPSTPRGATGLWVGGFAGVIVLGAGMAWFLTQPPPSEAASSAPATGTPSAPATSSEAAAPAVTRARELDPPNLPGATAEPTATPPASAAPDASAPDASANVAPPTSQPRPPRPSPVPDRAPSPPEPSRSLEDVLKKGRR